VKKYRILILSISNNITESSKLFADYILKDLYCLKGSLIGFVNVFYILKDMRP